MSPAETERAPRGSTRVVCRVRPLATSERGSCVETRGAEVTLAGSPSFSFDAVFPPTASNDAVFDAVRPTLEDVRAGINGAVLAYGQSGAGKSHTMNGGPGDPGVVQRVRARPTGSPSRLERAPQKFFLKKIVPSFLRSDLQSSAPTKRSKRHARHA